MIELFDGTTGHKIGEVTEHQMDRLIDCLNDGSGSERYVIDKDTLKYLASNGVEKPVVQMLNLALGNRNKFAFEYYIRDEPDIEFSSEEE